MLDQLYNYNLFGWQFKLNPVAFSVFGWKVYWYGILITIGFVLAVIYGIKRAPKFGINADRLIDCVLVTAPLSILGARLYYVIFKEEVTFKDFFAIHGGGLAIYGAVITAIVVGALMCKLRKVNILAALDLTALGFLLAQSIGRWGNFVNQEAYGTLTGSSWFGISGDRIIEDMKTDQLVHPCFLYESIWCILGFVILHFISKKRKFVGEVGALYLIWYGVGRFFIEYFRTDSLYLGSVRVSMILSAFLVVLGSVLLAVGLKNSTNKGKNQYVEVFDKVDETISAEEDKEEETTETESGAEDGDNN